MTVTRRAGHTLSMWLVVGACVWPMVMAAALVDSVDQHRTSLSTLVYVGSSRICHQRPERSFGWRGYPWPVCARCSGLYLAAPIGAVLARVRRPPARTENRARTLLFLAAVPTAATFLVEWGAPGLVTSMVRGLAALPLGAALAYLVVAVAGRPSEAIG